MTNDLAETSVQSPARRSRWLSIWALGTAVATGAAFALGSTIQSPWEEAVENARTPDVSATVVEQSLSLPMVEVAGVVHLGTSVPVIPTGSTDRMVVTEVGRAVGETLGPGEVLAHVSGRPLVAWPLPYPMYRDLTPGAIGEDVRAVQDVLSHAGVYDGALDGIYGAQTAQGVADYYKSLGLVPPPAAAESAELVDAASESLAAARQAFADAETSEAPAGEGEAGTALSPLRESIVKAQKGLGEALLAAAVPLPAAEVLVVPSEGVEVQDVAAVGAILGGEEPLATIRTGTPTVTSRITVEQFDSFPVGSQVLAVEGTGSSESSELVVKDVGEFSPGTADRPAGYDMTLAFTDTASFSDGAQVRIRPSDAETSVYGTVVPLVAIREDTSGYYVFVTSGEDRTRVPVEISVTVDGSAIVDSERLSAGDEVLVAGS
ncbi:peptidoglycan-binding protein [Actinotalea sp. C106]|uniref:peptidoglycan-binding protein n=1 Tax=Actinotalea sp. C106 TaxID=2908644 RepID=UPI002028E092|nr:peptidoglycan-binding protein [Actinotalea sp. C106]